jgi:hypothetical protein
MLLDRNPAAIRAAKPYPFPSMCDRPSLINRIAGDMQPSARSLDENQAPSGA